MRRYSVINEQYTRDFDGKSINREMKEIYIGKENGLSAEQIKIYADKNFEFKQMREIRLGFENGFSMEQVLVYANPKYTWLQMCEIRLGIENGLSVEQILIYADPKYTWLQMCEIRSGFENGLSIEQVLIYANESYKSFYMEQLRMWLELGLTMEQIKLIDIDCLGIDQKNEIAQMINMGLPDGEIERRINIMQYYNKRSKLINKFVRQYKKENKTLTKDELDRLLGETPDKINEKPKIKCKK